MKLVYVAGPYRAYREDGNYDIDTMFERTMKMRSVARKYLENGYAVIAPLLNSLLLDSPKLADDFWVEMDKELVKRCDAIVMMDGYELSRGAQAELEYAKGLGLEVIYDSV